MTAEDVAVRRRPKLEITSDRQVFVTMAEGNRRRRVLVSQVQP